MSRATRQQELRFRGRGGRRDGAGRKPVGAKAGVPHRRRPIDDDRHPIHVTMRCVRGLPSLRTTAVCAAVWRGLTAGSRPDRALHGADEPRPPARRGGRNAVTRTRHARARHSSGQSDQPAAWSLRARLVGPLPLPVSTDAARGSDRSDLRLTEWPETSRVRARDRSLLLGLLVRRLATRSESTDRPGAGCAGSDVATQRGVAARWADRLRRRAGGQSLGTHCRASG